MAVNLRKQSTWEEKRERINNITKNMERSIESYYETPEQLKEFLEFMANFYQYSPRNAALIRNQFHGALAVGSYQFWKEKGFHVKKGEKGIEVLVPRQSAHRYKDKKGKWKNIKFATEEEKELIKQGELEERRSKLYFTVGHVFDVSQTNATTKDLPEIFPNRWLEGEVENYKQVIKALHRIGEKIDVTIGAPFEELGSAKGAFYYAIETGGKGHIGLNPRNSELQNVKTLIHELAHAKLHHREHENHLKLSSAEKEFQAEMTAYAVASYFGIDTSDYSLRYLANWTKNKEFKDKERLLYEVRETAVEFIETIEKELIAEREVERASMMNEGDVLRYEQWKKENPHYLEMKKEELLKHATLAQQERWNQTGQGRSYDEHYGLLKGRTKEKLLIELYSRDIHVKEERIYWYEMWKRPVDIGCQPEGFIDFDNDKGRHGIVAYNRPLTEKELNDYDMRVWEGEKVKKRDKEMVVER